MQNITPDVENNPVGKPRRVRRWFINNPGIEGDYHEINSWLENNPVGPARLSHTHEGSKFGREYWIHNFFGVMRGLPICCEREDYPQDDPQCDEELCPGMVYGFSVCHSRFKPGEDLNDFANACFEYWYCPDLPAPRHFFFDPDIVF